MRRLLSFFFYNYEVDVHIKRLYSPAKTDRESAAAALVRIGRPAISALIQVLASDGNQAGSAARSALLALGEKAVPGLVLLAAENPRAHWLWDVLGSSTRVPEAVVRHMIPLMSYPRLDVRRFAIGIVANHANNHQSLAVEAPMLAALRDPETRWVATGFHNTTSVEFVDALVESLRDRNIYVRTRAAQSLVQMGEVAVLRLVPLLRDADAEVRRLAIQIIGAVGHILPYMIGRLSRNGELRDKIIQQAGATLIDLTRDPVTKVRRRAIKAHVTLRHPDAEATLTAALNDPDRTIRRDAAHALAELQAL